MKAEQIIQKLETTLKPKRFRHTQAVSELAVDLAARLGEDCHKIQIAALLHDCAKGIKKKDQIEFAKTNQVPLSSNDIIAPGVIHARNGRFIAEKEYGIKDSVILDAIYYHPTGYEWMTLFQRILFVADYLDPNRKLDTTEELTNLAFADFEASVLEIIIHKNNYVIMKRHCLHPDSINFYNAQLIRVKEQVQKKK